MTGCFWSWQIAPKPARPIMNNFHSDSQTNTLLDALLENALDAVISINSEGIIIGWNKQAEVIFGWSKEDAMGLPLVNTIIPPRYREAHTAGLKIFLTKGESSLLSRRINISALHSDGHEFPVELTITPLQSDNTLRFSAFIRDITHRHQLADELEQQVAERTALLAQTNQELTLEIAERKRFEWRYRTLFEEAPVMYVLTEDINGTPYIKDCNLLFTNVICHSRSNIIGRPLADFYTPASQETMLDGGYQRALSGRFSIEERQLVTHDGRIIETILQAKPEKGADGQVIGTRAMFIDITERKQVEAVERAQHELAEALHQAALVISASLDIEQILEHLLDQIARVIPYDAANIMLVKNGRTQPACWRGYEQVGPTTEQDIINRSFEIAHTPNLKTIHDTGEPLIIDNITEDAGQLAGGAKLCHSWAGAPITIQGEVTAFLILNKKEPNFYQATDAERLTLFASQTAIALKNAQLYEQTRRHAAQLEERVAERTTELRVANAELARAARLKDEFLANMSHELRTPLNAILGLSDALQEQAFGSLNEDQLETLHDISESGRHLLSLINDILDLSKIEAGKLELQIEPVSVQDISRACMRLIRQMGLGKQLKMLITLDETLTTIPADARYLKQILVNLLSNAIKFTRPGGQIGLEVMGDTAQDIIHFTVWDTGIGIAAEDMDRLFQPFVQLDSRLDKRYNGTGLGLVLVYRLVELHDGHVSVTSEPDQGSRFTATLPWKQGVADEIEPPDTQEIDPPSIAQPASGTEEQALKSENQPQPLILLAEDNEANIKTFSRYLSQTGYRVEVALNGIEAITQARSLQPDLILMDIQMPEMDGLDATRHLRADPQLTNVPIIAITALAMPGDRERCLAAGVNEYLSKPVNLKNLTHIIRNLLASTV